MGNRKRIMVNTRIMMYDFLPDNFENEEQEVYLGYGRYIKAKPRNIRYSDMLKLYLVTYTWTPSMIYTKIK